MICASQACTREALALGRKVSGGESCFPSCPTATVTFPEAQPIDFEGLVGAGEWLKHLRSVVERVAPLPTSVLICGESGTGKERVARAIHARSGREGKPFVAVNCAALPASLLESELFGHEKGAFTGATSASEGLWRSAKEGTLFLDEIGEMPVKLQSKLLRALETREVQPVGSARARPVEARIVAATNRDIKAAVAEGSFREDLYFRLSVVVIRIPPLRERSEDLPVLAGYFLKRLSESLGRPNLTLCSETMRVLLEHSWPGNVRELSNALERAAIFSEGELIAPRDLSEDGVLSDRVDLLPLDLRSATKRFEIDHIKRVLRLCGGNKRRAARLLGLGPTSLYRKLGTAP